MTWMCGNGHDKQLEFESNEAFTAHLREAHNIHDVKGRRQMELHLDCAKEAISIYKWTIGGLEFHQSVSCPRGGRR